MSRAIRDWFSRLPDFWRNSGFHLLERDSAGRLRVTDDFLRAYYLRPEVHPVEESCEAERALHACLMAEPRRAVDENALQSIQDQDARDNYRVVLRFRQKLLDADSVEGCYMKLFKGAVDVPPLFIEQLAHVVLRNLLDRCTDPLQLRPTLIRGVEFVEDRVLRTSVARRFGSEFVLRRALARAYRPRDGLRLTRQEAAGDGLVRARNFVRRCRLTALAVRIVRPPGRIAALLLQPVLLSEPLGIFLAALVGHPAPPVIAFAESMRGAS